MGFAIADAASEAGADVTLITGPSSLTAKTDLKFIKIESTEEMFKAVNREFKNCHYLIMAAAPSDFKPVDVAGQKIKKNKKEKLNIELKPTIDILSSIKKIKKKSQKVIGFALETENGRKNAKDKLVLFCLDGAGPFESDSNTVELIDKRGQVEKLSKMNKTELARLLIEKIARLK